MAPAPAWPPDAEAPGPAPARPAEPEPLPPSAEAAPGAGLWARRDAPVGGQAVLEGVMMRGVRHWAVAVRRPSPEQLAAVRAAGRDALPHDEGARGPVEVERFALPAPRRGRVLRLPVVRGVVALVDSLRIGMRALAVSAEAQQPEDAPPIPRSQWALAGVLGLALAVGLFFVVPVVLTSLVKDELGSATLFWLVEGIVRTAIFVGYLWAVARLGHLRRVFEFHGAEHKAISCHEAGLPLTPEQAQRFSRLHPRCGTSFLLVVMVVAIFVFAPLGLPDWWLLVASRVLGIPLVAGLAFEVIKWAGRHRSHRAVRAVMWPGLQLQRLTTREPDHGQLVVAIAALTAVLEADEGTRPGDAELAEMAVAA